MNRGVGVVHVEAVPLAGTGDQERIPRSRAARSRNMRHRTTIDDDVRCAALTTRCNHGNREATSAARKRNALRARCGHALEARRIGAGDRQPE